MRRLLIPILILVILAVVIVVFVVLRPGSSPAPSGTPGTQTANNNAPTATPAPTLELVPVVIAIQSLPRGFVITNDSVELRNEPRTMVPASAISKLEDVVGHITRTDIFVEEPILTSMIVDVLGTNGGESLAHIGSDAAAVIPGNLVMVSVPMDRLTGDAYAIQDGDHVDVMVSMLFVDVDEDFQSIQPNGITLFTIDPTTGTIHITDAIVGRLETTSSGPAVVGPSERQRPRLVTQRTIQNALVVHVGDFPPDGRFVGITPTPAVVPTTQAQGTPQSSSQQQGTPVPTPTLTRPDIISLAVSPQDAVAITYMVEAHLPITLALRSVNNSAQTATDPVTLDYLMTQYNIQLPGKRPFALEPAIRSIRQLLVGNQITLSEGITAQQNSTDSGSNSNSGGGGSGGSSYKSRSDGWGGITLP